MLKEEKIYFQIVLIRSDLKKVLSKLQNKGSVYRPPFRQYERRYERNNCYQKREKNYHQDRLCKWTDSYEDRRPESVEIDSSWSELQPRNERLEKELFAGVLSGKSA